MKKEKRCPRCKIIKPVSEYYLTKDGTRLDSYCKTCRLKTNKIWYENNSVAAKTRSRKYNHSENAQVARKRYEQSPEGKLVRKKTMLKYRLKIKRQVLAHYGPGGVCACAHCGEQDMVCLTIDHIKAVGNNRERPGGIAFYLWLKNQNYPKGYQTLCMNCNWKKRDRNGEYGGFTSKNTNKEIYI